MTIKILKNVFKGQNWNKILKIWLVKILIQQCNVARSKIFCDVGFDCTILFSYNKWKHASQRYIDSSGRSAFFLNCNY